MADILIRGMEMPKYCSGCPLQKDNLYTGHLFCMPRLELIHVNFSTGRDDFCPLVPLQKGHGRLVDADALVADTSFFDGDDWYYGYSAKQIQNAPTILEAEGGLRNDS